MLQIWGVEVEVPLHGRAMTCNIGESISAQADINEAANGSQWY